VSEDVAKEVIQKAWLLHQGERISQIGIDICNGKQVDIQKAREILEKINEESFFDGDEDLVEVSSELEDILEAMHVT
ncbi:hypothetical protein, partial [Klebsiella pneumoniae]|uniref:hypothetical protein n=1 Tax=Klebsiella pneumoniae TaxID=573 RepID=UPI001D0E4E36